MLARRFDWNDTATIYRRVDEEKSVENMGKSKYSFTAFSVDGKKFIGQAFETTVGDMCNFVNWKLEEIPSKKDPTKTIRIVVEATIKKAK
jgi:hypothetical protein